MKRGISELISVVLIIGFVVALSAIIITSGSRFVSETQSDVDVTSQASLACSKINFKIKNVFCNNGNLNSIQILNNADQQIEAFVLRVTDINENIFVNEEPVMSPSPLTPLASSTITSNILNPKKIELIPKIKDINNELFVCVGAKTEFNIDNNYDNGDCRGTVVPGSCNNNGDCSGATPFCLSGSCVACLTDSQCDDNNLCNGQETCVNNQCSTVVGTEINCNDGIPCTQDTCDPLFGTCSYDATSCSCTINSQCDDSNPCNGAETCSLNACISGTNAPASTPCSAGMCDGNGRCVNCIMDVDCQNLYGELNWICNNNNVCEPTPVESGVLYSSSLNNYIDTLSTLDQSWIQNNLGYWIRTDGSDNGCVKSSCSQIFNINLPGSCWNDAQSCNFLQYGCMQIAANIVNPPYNDASCTGVQNIQHTCNGETYQIYTSQLACTIALY